MRQVELLAPAGSWEALVAAVQNGADAVYIGGKAFSARQNASNFDAEELKKAVAYCHIRGVKVFVTVNTLVANEELEALAKYLAFLYNQDVDAVIVQDLGVAKMVKDFFPDFEIHASTQMSVHNGEGVKLLEDLGFQRVVLAREMSLEEIKAVRKHSNVDLEVFIHGALCVCYSGQCLMSSMIGGRSGNRGRCAQPCRMPYRLVDMERGRELKSQEGDYLLSPRDLNTLENLHRILETGVKSLKIEGRLKRPEYVATVVGAYRKAIDQYFHTLSKIEADPETLKDVEQIFNRKFTKGYILGDWGRKIMSFEKPSNRGIRVGEVEFYDKQRKKVRVKLEAVLHKGDGIEIWTEKGDSPGTVVEGLFVDGEKRDRGRKGERIEISFKHAVSKGQAVYKTSDIRLLQRAKESYEGVEKQIPIHGVFQGKIWENLSLALWDEEGNHVWQQGDYVVEKALHRPIGEDRVREQLIKLGGTPYVFESLEIWLDEGGAIPIGEINRLRRDAVQQLDECRANRHRRKKIEGDGMKQKLEKWLPYRHVDGNRNISLRVTVNSLQQLKAVLTFDVDRIYYTDTGRLEEALALVRDRKVELVPAFSRITDEQNLEEIKEILMKHHDLQGLLVANLGILNLTKKMNYKPIYGDFSLNVFNSGAVELLYRMGLDEVVLSPELTLKQIREILTNAPIPCEIIVQGYLPCMVMKYCPTTAVMSRRGEQENCSLCRNSRLGIKDRMGMIFPIITDDHCRTHILNSQSLCLIEHMEEILDAGAVNLRIHFTMEDQEEIRETLQAYREVIAHGKITAQAEGFLHRMRKKGLTKGHFYRGVL
ncbi:DUF3656 domain-containing U32 family peptidase [Thermotalea metallivorans]|uniref:Putative protease YdcP n=1 Tax=Thermotalea metallivorans TaxID=520762 RepID=A0A140L1G0_9FIRM|nr:U32 family peptidase [Thermotalea metallivorans]KXG74385.1 putative protease YdcP [Thermotalea metallivorans]